MYKTVSLRVMIATSSDAVSSRIRRDLIKVLYQHTMYVISLFNISIKTNFKQITRVELKLTNVYHTLRETTFCAQCHIIRCRSFINDTIQFNITFSVII